MELDLGYRGNLIFTKKSVEEILSKVFIREKPMYGIRGKEYATNLYQIPEVKIGKMTFSKPILQEEGDEFLNDATFVIDGGERSMRPPGRIGWELFYNVNLLIDAKNSLVAFCDSPETLEKHGYPFRNFTETPLILKRGLVEFMAETLDGTLRCTLDTGATLNMLNDQEDQSADQAIRDSQNALSYSSFTIEGKDFGPIAFHKVPIKIPIRIDAILGMEFFQEHLVFLDFSGKKGYFLKRPPDHEK